METKDISCEMEMPAKEDYTRRISYQMKIFDHMIRRYMDGLMRENNVDGMSMVNAWIIDYLSCNADHDIFQKDIERQFKTSKSSIASTLKMMEEKGFILRQAVEDDARLKKVCLTEKGQAYTNKLEQCRIKTEEQIRKDLSAEEINLFLRIISKMQENISTIKKE